MAGVTSATGVTAVDGTSPTSPILAQDGTAAAPSYADITQPGTGISFPSSGAHLAFGLQGSRVAVFTSNGGVFRINGSLGFVSGDPEAVAEDIVLARDAANTLAQKNGVNAQAFRVYAGNGGFIANVQSVTESLIIAAAATTVSATTIPANAILLGVSVRVTTVIPTAATFTYATTVGATSIPAGAILLGVSVRVTTVIPTAATFTYATTVGGTALQTAAVSSAANSTDPGTAAGASFRAAATTVTITPNVSPAAATGVVRLQYYYLQITPPTS